MTTSEEYYDTHTWQPVSPSRRGLSASLNSLVDNIYPPIDYSFLNEEAKARLSAVIKYYDFYELEGQRWDAEALDYKPEVMPVNLARWLIDKKAAWEFEETPDVKATPKRVDSPLMLAKPDYVPSPEQEGADGQAMARQQLLDKVWKENHLPEHLLEAAKDRRIGGLVAIKLTWSNTKGVRIFFRPCLEVFPHTDPDDLMDIQTCHFVSWRDNDRQLWKQTFKMEDGECYWSEGLYQPNLILSKDLSNGLQPLDLDFMPVVLVPNKTVSNMLFGYSDLADLIPILTVYNKRMSDYADVLRFNMFAIAVLSNVAPGTSNNLKYSPGEIWEIQAPLGSNPSAEFLESSFSFREALHNFLNRLETLSHKLANVPQLDPEKVSGTGVQSGQALKLLHASLISETNQAMKVWTSRLSLMNEYALRYIESYRGRQGFPEDLYPLDLVEQIDGFYENEIIPRLPLPQNKVEEVDIAVKEVAMSIKSLKAVMKDLGVQYPEQMLAEILAEREQFVGSEVGEYGKIVEPGEAEKLYGGQGAANAGADGTVPDVSRVRPASRPVVRRSRKPNNGPAE